MQDKERETLKANAEELAGLLTENIPFLIKHYITTGVLTEAEREDIIQEASAHEIKKNLVMTLAAKEGVSLEAVMAGLNATENQCVAQEIANLLSSGKESAAPDASGDGGEDVSFYATSLVDDVIATAEQRLSLSEGEDVQKLSLTNDDEEENVETPNAEMETEIAGRSVSDTSLDAEVVVHEIESAIESSDPVEDVPDKSVAFVETAETVSNHEQVEEPEVISAASSPVGVFGQNESDAEDMDNIDIEKEFEMVSQEVSNQNNNSVPNGSGDKQIDAIIENGNTDYQEDNDNELAAALARKALVRQQVEMFEKNSPGGGKVKYTLRTAGEEKVDKDQNDSGGSNVKSLKNFFQRLSSDKETTTPTAPAKAVGKLKVTFPAT